MSCWVCECGFRNCDTDDCFNPKCPSQAGYTYDEAVKVASPECLRGLATFNGCYSREDVNSCME